MCDTNGCSLFNLGPYRVFPNGTTSLTLASSLLTYYYNWPWFKRVYADLAHCYHIRHKDEITAI